MDENNSFFKNVPLSFEQVANDNAYSDRKFDLDLSTGYVPFFEHFFEELGKKRDAQVLVIGCEEASFIRSVADYFINGSVKYISCSTEMSRTLKHQEEFTESNIVKIGSYTNKSGLDLDKAVHKGEYKNLNVVIDMSLFEFQKKNFSKISKLQKKNSRYLMITSSSSPRYVKEGGEVYEIEGTNDRITVFKK
jgi:hypothetical protein